MTRISPIPRPWALAIPVLILAMLSGCLGGGTEPAGVMAAAVPHITSSVALMRRPPDCAIVMPAAGAIDPSAAAMVETVVARHFAQRLPRLIGPSQRRARARDGAYDLRDTVERVRFARTMSCRHGLEIKVHSSGEAYAIAWAVRHVDLSVTLVRFADEKALWSARHALDRSAGGLPTGPLSLVVDSVRAGGFASDRDGTEALIEDVIRQTARAFPDLRQIQ